MLLLKNPDVVKKNVYNVKFKNIEVKIPDITNIATNTILNPKINQVKKEITSFTNLTATTALTAIENEILNISN